MAARMPPRSQPRHAGLTLPISTASKGQTMQTHPRGTRRHTPAGLTALGLLALGACASVPPPTTQLAVSTAALAHATAAAGQGPAQPELALARDKLRRANQALADKDNLTAGQLAQEAQLDALVAESRGETAKARLAAQEVQAAGRALADELARKTP
jgi:hypothetical protein